MLKPQWYKILRRSFFVSLTSLRIHTVQKGARLAPGFSGGPCDARLWIQGPRLKDKRACRDKDGAEEQGWDVVSGRWGIWQWGYQRGGMGQGTTVIRRWWTPGEEVPNISSSRCKGAEKWVNGDQSPKNWRLRESSKSKTAPTGLAWAAGGSSCVGWPFSDSDPFLAWHIFGGISSRDSKGPAGWRTRAKGGLSVGSVLHIGRCGDLLNISFSLQL